MEWKVAVVTVSDSGNAGLRADDVSGDSAQQILEEAGFIVPLRRIIPDDADIIAGTLKDLCPQVHGIVTTGGTGVAARDVTPDATRSILDKELPGMAEAMRLESLRHTPFAMLSRQVVGIRGQTLIVNLPGSPRAVRECLQVILPVLGHTFKLLSGQTSHDA